MKVSAVFVATGAGEAALLESSLPALFAQVDELVVVANGPGASLTVAGRSPLVENERPLGFSANVNKGIEATSGEYVVISNPDAIPEPDAFRSSSPSPTRIRAAAWPARGCSTRTGRSRRPGAASPPSAGRSSAARPCARSSRRSSGSAGTTCWTSPSDKPMQVDTMLGAFLLMRRTMLEQIGGWDAGYKLYVEDIDLSYRAMKAGWERWWVPSAVVHHEYQAVIDKQFFTRRNLWHLHAMLRFLRKHPERLFALR